MTRLNIEVPDELVEQFDDVAAAHHRSRSGHLRFLMEQAVRQHDNSTAGLPADLAAVLRDGSILVPQDSAVFDLIAKWRNAPSNTASGDTSPDDAGRSSGGGDAVICPDCKNPVSSHEMYPWKGCPVVRLPLPLVLTGDELERLTQWFGVVETEGMEDDADAALIAKIEAARPGSMPSIGDKS